MRWNDRIGRRIKLSDLHILLAVAQCGSMAKAAGLLSVSHPVVSRAISDLEHTLGVRLLDRTPHGVTVTPYGRAMLGRSHAAFDELRQGVRDIEFLADPTAGEVRVGSTPPLAASVVSAVVDQLSRRHPRIVFRVFTDDSETLHRALQERAMDLLIVRQFGPVAEGANFEVLYDNPYVVAAGRENPWLRRRNIALADLVNEPWALPPRESAVGALAEQAFRACGLPSPRPTVVAFAHEMRINLLATGRYLTVLPESLLKVPAPHPLIRKLPVTLPIASGPIGILTPAHRTLSPVAQLFIEAARDVATSSAEAKSGRRGLVPARISKATIGDYHSPSRRAKSPGEEES
jgi:DNA-binding transcriptional LysR family regulator